jgi:hypothetical protein
MSPPRPAQRSQWAVVRMPSSSRVVVAAQRLSQSVVFVGVVGLTGRPTNWMWLAGPVLGFGLVHGLGLSTRLQNLGLPAEGVIPRLLAFNLGVEIGQLLAVLGLFMFADVACHYLPPLRQPRWTHGVLVTAGTAAAGALAIAGDGP